MFQVDQLREAIEELYYFEFVVDEIPIWGFVGYMEETGFLPHSHKVRTSLCSRMTLSECAAVRLVSLRESRTICVQSYFH